MRALALANLLLFAAGCGCGATPPGRPSCPAEQQACGSECALLTENDRHCGACATACADSESCAASKCYPDDCETADCSASQVCPAGKCVEKSCVGVSCPAGQGCLGGACVSQNCTNLSCPAEFICVNGACTDAACLGVLCPAGQACSRGACQAGTCDDGLASPGETDVDCGGNCTRKCEVGRLCGSAADCVTNVCTASRCAAPSTCANGSRDGSETDVDCGGGCPNLCRAGQLCSLPGDCTTGQCVAGQCVQSGNCTDSVKNGTETDVDCGGPDCTRRCPDGQACTAGADCASVSCVTQVCAAPTCTDNARNGAETDVDCGGTCTRKCATGQRCAALTDCVDRVCTNGACAAPVCTDGVKNGSESDTDCGGSCAKKCGANKLCGTPSDCASGVCTTMHCVGEPTCVDGQKNQDEVDTDCGGTMCLPCADGKMCNVPADCLNGFCNASMVCSRGFPMRDVYTPVTSANLHIACGRLNSDAYADVLIAGQQLALLLGTPTGALSVPAPVAGVGFVAGVADLQVLDIDKDGKLDAVAPFYNNGGNGSTHVAVLRGNGNGTFGSVLDSIYATGLVYPNTGPFGVADMNGDGFLDLIVPFFSGTTSGPGVMLGNGAGNFATAVVYPGVSNTNQIRSCIAADFDGDGVADVATVHSGVGSGLGSIHLYSNTDGGVLTVQASTYSTGAGNAYEVLTAVLTDAGTNDVVVGTYGMTAMVNVLRHTTGYNFTASTYQSGYVYGTAVSDLNLDGHLDLAVASDNNILLLLGDGRGNFNTGPNVLMSGTGDIAVCDFNGDGRPDIAQLTSAQVNVFINR